MASIRIEDLEPIQQLNAEEAEQLIGAGRGRQARLGLESLECRQVPTATLLNGVLNITGTAGADTVTVSAQKATVGTQNVTTIAVSDNGVVTTYAQSDPSKVVKEIKFTGGAGNDRFRVEPAATQYTVTYVDVNVPVSADGGADIDTLYNGSRRPAIFRGGEGNDYLYGNVGADQLFGDGGDDRLYGWSGNDVLDGGAGNDVLQGQDGDDVLQGGIGDDVLYGADGDDTLSGDPDDATTAGSDSLSGDAGIDVVKAKGNVNFTLTNTQLTGLGTDALLGIEKASLTGGADSNTLDASAFTGSVTLAGGAGGDALIGGKGADLLHGNDGDDYLFGGSGNDVIYGDSGNDGLRGGAGDDVLFGGTDRAVGDAYNDPISRQTAYYQNSFAGGLGSDKIYGAEGFDGMLGDDSAHNLAQDALDMGLASVPLDGKDFLYGYGGNDVLCGGAGDDFLAGGDNWDILVGQGGNDVLYANDAGIYRDPALDWTQSFWRGSAPKGPSGSPREVLFGDYALDGHGNFIPDAAGHFDNEGNDAVYGTAGTDVIGFGSGSNSFDGKGGSDVIL